MDAKMSFLLKKETSERKKQINKGGQVTIFIILAMIIIVILAILFLLRTPIKTQVIDEDNPQAYIESCTREAVEEALDILSPQGGDIKPKGSVLYNGISITHLCYTEDFYRTCINQRPLLPEHIENEITNYITPIVKGCFQNMENYLERRYEVEVGEMNLTTRIYPDNLVVEIEKKIKLTREDKIRKYENFRMNMITPIYNFAKIATEITNQEAQFCHFEELGFMILYPRWDVQSTITGDSHTIYLIKERTTNQKFQFATKSCVLPAGL